MSNNYKWNKHISEPSQKSSKNGFKKVIRKHWNWLFLGVTLLGFLAYYNYAVIESTSEDWYALVILILLYFIANRLYNYFSHVKSLMLGFVYPLFLAILVLIVGTYGYHAHSPSNPWSNSFFSAANLITLNSSEFSNIPKPSVHLRFARLLGGFLAGYAFLLAFALAVGKENMSRLSFWIFRGWNIKKNWFGKSEFHLPFGKKVFQVVIGNSDKALDLAYDLIKHNAYFVFLDTSSDDYIRDTLKDVNCWYFKGKAFSKKNLKGTYLWHANKVFIMNNEDENNFRAIHEIDELLVVHPNSELKLHVHFEEQKLRESVHTLIARRSSQINAFNICQNTATRLLNDYPIDRFTNEIEVAQIVIIGFTKQAQELVMACCRIGHYLDNYKLKINVFLPEENQKDKVQFLKNHPVLDKANYAHNFKNELHAEIIDDTFKNIILTFEDLPDSESSIRSIDFQLYNLLLTNSACTLYSCLDDGMKNAQFLDSCLPRLAFLKSKEQRDIQVFSYYNYPDKDEQDYIETKLNVLAPQIQVFCFGNMLDECSVNMIENINNQSLAKRIALIYHCIFDGLSDNETTEWEKINTIKDELYARSAKVSKDETLIDSYKKEKKKLLAEFFKIFNAMENYEEFSESFWKTLKQIDRESNIQAANHAAVKCRQMGYDITEKNLTVWTDEELEKLSKIEHLRWNAEKLLIGWQPYINKKDWSKYKTELRAQKYHNYLVKFENLPEYEKSKDWIQVMGLLCKKEFYK